MISQLVALVLASGVFSNGSPSDGSKIEKHNIEYHPSTGLNLILGVPHGGGRHPASIPDRDVGCWNEEKNQCEWRHGCRVPNSQWCSPVTEGDWNTVELALRIRNNTCALFGGHCPAVVINLLSRSKLDANRDLSEATCNVSEAVDSFVAYHEFIEEEKQKIEPEVGGLYVDVHGHSHSIQRAELGYLLNASDLEMDPRVSLARSSIRNLAAKYSNDTEKLTALLRGKESLGWFLEQRGYKAVPSVRFPSPGNHSFFSGGYNTRRHGSRYTGFVDAVQLESCWRARRAWNISDYACAVSLALKDFLCTHYYAERSPIIADGIRRSCQTHSSMDDCRNYSFNRN